MKNHNGSAYIFVLMVLCISSLIFNCAIGVINNKSEIKHSQNNNLYYIWECNTDKFQQMMNDILKISIKQAKENSSSEVEIFKNNFDKIFGDNGFTIRIENQPHIYITDIEITNKIDSLLYYEIKSATMDEFNNNKIEKEFVLRRDGTEFILLNK